MKRVLLVLAISIILVATASAENVSAYRSVTCQGPTGMLIPLGIENVMPLQAALYWYQWISSGLIMLVGALASKRNYHFIAIFLPITAAIVTWAGWFHTGNAVQAWSIIILFGVLGAAIYMKATLKENFGIGGPGSTLMNLVVFMILISATFGLVNSSEIWKDNPGVASEQFSNVDLEQQVTSLSNTGGWMDSVINGGTAFITAAIGSLKVLITMMISIGFFSAAILVMYPWIASSGVAVGLLGLMQAAIWICYAKIITDILYFKNIYSSEF